MQTLNIRAVQSDIIWENPKGNLDNLTALLKNAQKDELVVLPEMFATGFSMNTEKTAQSMNGEIVSWMKESSEDKMVCGTVAIEDDGKYYNRFIACYRGEITCKYDKRHLFSYAGEDRHYTPGKDVTVFEFQGWKIKPLICYDLRFPVWCRNKEEADLMLFCANWPEARIQAWNALLAARAIENQCFVLGVNRVGLDGKQKQHNGQTQLCDPLGSQINPCGDSEAVFEYSVQREVLQSIRIEYPFLRDSDLFTVLV
ncbi:MAG: nitrilase-related carbon-nitrogen hydrolase [Sphingomonadales bacterium]|jgi:omega-amidase